MDTVTREWGKAIPQNEYSATDAELLEIARLANNCARNIGTSIQDEPGKVCCGCGMEYKLENGSTVQVMVSLKLEDEDET